MRVASVTDSSDGPLESDVFRFLETLPSSIFDRLYEHSPTCFAVFRFLSSSAKLYVMRLLFLSGTLPASVVQSWYKKGWKTKHTFALKQLRNLHILADAVPTEEGTAYQLHASFQRHLSIALFGGKANAFGIAVPMYHVSPISESTTAAAAHVASGKEVDVESAEDEPVTISYLDHYATSKWDVILHFMIGTLPEEQEMSRNVITLLIAAGIMVEAAATDTTGEMADDDGDRNKEKDSDDDEYGKRPRRQVAKASAPKRAKKEEETVLRITDRGFQFLLQDTRTQLWMLLLKYIQLAEMLNLDLCEALQFLFWLSTLQFGHAYSVKPFSPTQHAVLEELMHLGLVVVRKKHDIYYPTRLASHLSATHSTVDTVAVRGIVDASLLVKGFLLIETNYRIYAYTDSPIQIAILSLFTTLIYRFANMVVAVITRESVHEAFKNGITANQIIAYLYSHAHAQMRTRTPVLPPTLVDQIRLWELERQRLMTTSATVYHDLENKEHFEAIRSFAEKIGALLYANSDKAMIVVHAHQHPVVRAFIKQEMARGVKL